MPPIAPPTLSDDDVEAPSPLLRLEDFSPFATGNNRQQRPATANTAQHSALSTRHSFSTLEDAAPIFAARAVPEAPADRLRSAARTLYTGQPEPGGEGVGSLAQATSSSVMPEQGRAQNAAASRVASLVNPVYPDSQAPRTPLQRLSDRAAMSDNDLVNLALAGLAGDKEAERVAKEEGAIRSAAAAVTPQRLAQEREIELLNAQAGGAGSYQIADLRRHPFHTDDEYARRVLAERMLFPSGIARDVPQFDTRPTGFAGFERNVVKSTAGMFSQDVRQAQPGAGFGGFAGNVVGMGAQIAATIAAPEVAIPALAIAHGGAISRDTGDPRLGIAGGLAEAAINTAGLKPVARAAEAGAAKLLAPLVGGPVSKPLNELTRQEIAAEFARVAPAVFGAKLAGGAADAVFRNVSGTAADNLIRFAGGHQDATETLNAILEALPENVALGAVAGPLSRVPGLLPSLWAAGKYRRADAAYKAAEGEYQQSRDASRESRVGPEGESVRGAAQEAAGPQDGGGIVRVVVDGPAEATPQRGPVVPVEARGVNPEGPGVALGVEGVGGEVGLGRTGREQVVDRLGDGGRVNGADVANRQAGDGAQTRGVGLGDAHAGHDAADRDAQGAIDSNLIHAAPARASAIEGKAETETAQPTRGAIPLPGQPRQEAQGQPVRGEGVGVDAEQGAGRGGHVLQDSRADGIVSSAETRTALPEPLAARYESATPSQRKVLDVLAQRSGEVTRGAIAEAAGVSEATVGGALRTLGVRPARPGVYTGFATGGAPSSSAPSSGTKQPERLMSARREDKPEGSRNLETAVSKGHVIGEARYADVIPHHVRNDGGAWTYENTHDPRREELLYRIIDGDNSSGKELSADVSMSERFPALTNDPVRDYEKAMKDGSVRASLLRTNGNVVDEVKLPKDGEGFYVTSDGWDEVKQHGDDWVANYSKATIHREPLGPERLAASNSKPPNPRSGAQPAWVTERTAPPVPGKPLPPRKTESKIGRKLVGAIEKDPQGKRSGVRSIADALAKAMDVQVLQRREQTSGTHPAHYETRPHLVRTRDISAAAYTFHEHGHALSALLRDKDPGFLANHQAFLKSLTQRPDSFASADSAEEGFAEFTRLLVQDPAVLEAMPETAAVLADIEKVRPDLLGLVRDAARAYDAHKGRSLEAQWRSTMNDTGQRPGRVGSVMQHLAVELVSRGLAVDFATKPTFRAIADFSASAVEGAKNLLAARDATTYTAADPKLNYASLANIARLTQVALEGPGGHVKKGEPTGLRFHATLRPGEPMLTPQERTDLAAAGFTVPAEPKQHGEMVILGAKSIRDVITQIPGKEWDDFETYVQMKASVARFEAAGHDYPLLLEGTTPAELKAAVLRAESDHPQWEAVARELEQIDNQALLLDVIGGLISAEDAITAKGKYTFYAPLTRQGVFGPERIGPGATATPTGGTKRAWGNTRAAEPLLLAMARKVSDTLNGYYWNRFLRSLVGFGDAIAALPDVPPEAKREAARVAVKLSMDMKKVATVKGETIEQIVSKAIEAQAAAGNPEFAQYTGLSADDIRKRLALALNPQEIWRRQPPNAIRVVAPKVKGERAFYQVNDPDLFNIFAAQDSPGKLLGSLAAVFEPITAKWKQLITNELAFTLRNIIRDAPTAMMISRGGPEAMAPFYYHAVGALASATGKTPQSLVNPELLAKTFQHYTAEDFAARRGKAMQLLLNGIEQKGWKNKDLLAKALSFPGIVNAIIMKPWEVKLALTQESRLAQFVEAAPRQGAFINAKAKGHSDEAAQYLADYVTGNFGERPASPVAATLYRMAGFINPAVQITRQEFIDPFVGGPRTAGDNARTGRGKAGAALRLAGVAGFTIAAWALVNALASDEQRRMNRERTLDERVLNAQVGPFRVPFEHGPVGAMQSYLWNTLDNLAGNSPADQAKLLSQIVKSNPVPLPLPQDLLGLVPPIPKTWMEIALNRSFYRKADIVPEHMKYLEPEQQYFAGTLETYRQLGKVLDVSPLQIEYALRNGLSSQIHETLNLVERLQSGLTIDEAADTPFVGRLFTREPRGYQSASVQSLGELDQQYRQLARRMKMIEDDPGVDDATRQRLQMQQDALEDAHAAMLEVNRLAREARTARQEKDLQGAKEYEREMTRVAREFLYGGGEEKPPVKK